MSKVFWSSVESLALGGDGGLTGCLQALRSTALVSHDKNTAKFCCSFYLRASVMKMSLPKLEETKTLNKYGYWTEFLKILPYSFVSRPNNS